MITTSLVTAPSWSTTWIPAEAPSCYATPSKSPHFEQLVTTASLILQLQSEAAQNLPVETAVRRSQDSEIHLLDTSHLATGRLMKSLTGGFKKAKMTFHSASLPSNFITLGSLLACALVRQP